VIRKHQKGCLALEMDSPMPDKPFTHTSLFDAAVQQALGGETLEALMTTHCAAVARGDLERVRLIDEMVREAVTLGNHAVVAEHSARNRT
jgi:hypothetical protein